MRHQKGNSKLQFYESNQKNHGNPLSLPKADSKKSSIVSRSSALPHDVLSDIENSARHLRTVDVSIKDMMPALKDKNS